MNKQTNKRTNERHKTNKQNKQTKQTNKQTTNRTNKQTKQKERIVTFGTCSLPAFLIDGRTFLSFTFTVGSHQRARTSQFTFKNCVGDNIFTQYRKDYIHLENVVCKNNLIKKRSRCIQKSLQHLSFLLWNLADWGMRSI